MAHDLGADLHELFPQASQRPLLDCLRQSQRPHEVCEIVGQPSMIALVFDNPKLIMLFLLIGTIIRLSHVSGENLAKMKHENDSKRWRDNVPRSR